MSEPSAAPSVSTASFGQLLRLYRTAAGLSQEALAERAALSVDAVAALERGRRQRPHPSTFRLLADALALTPEQRARLGATLASSATRSRVASNLPRPLTSFVGRVDERLEIGRLIRHAAVRMVTLTGPGGVGKTRLAVEAAAELTGDFPDGVFLIELAGLNDVRLLLPAIAQLLGMVETGSGALAGSLKHYLRQRHVLFVLDNFEHLLAGAPSVVDLLLHCPAVKAMITSRAALRVSGEYEFPVPPLAVPRREESGPHMEGTAYAAVQLFLQRAQAARLDWEATAQDLDLIGEICRRLDGLPLAIELAAARSSRLGPVAVLARLRAKRDVLGAGPRDAPERHQTMNRAIGWSYDLLDPPERQLLQRLSVFNGDFEPEAAEAVCFEQGAGSEAWLMLSSLIEQNLVTHTITESGEPRLRMLQTIREFAASLLNRSGESDVVRLRHAHYYRHLAEEDACDPVHAIDNAWAQRLEQEHDNLRAALSVLAEGPEIDPALRLAGVLWPFWYAHGHLTEGRQWLGHILSRATDQSDDSSLLLCAKALHAAGVLAWAQGDRQTAAAVAENALTIYRKLGHAAGVTDALIVLGLAAMDQRDLSKARVMTEERLALSRELGDNARWGHAVMSLGIIALLEGQPGRAEELLREALELLLRIERNFFVSITLTYLARAVYARGDISEARTCYEAALERSLALQDKLRAASAIEGLSVVVSAREPDLAVRLLGSAAALRAAIGAAPSGFERDAIDQAIDTLQNALSEERFAAAWADGEQMTLSQAVELAVPTGRTAVSTASTSRFGADADAPHG